MMNPAAAMEKVPAYSTWGNSQRPQVTSYTFTGPTAGSNGVPSTAFTIAFPPNVSVPTDVTFIPADSGTGNAGVFTPTSVLLGDNQTSRTFTYTPGSTGAKIISVTNNAGFTNPANITYTSS
jgi:hypothetical protein